MKRNRRSELLQPEHHWWHRMKISTQKFSIGLCVLSVSLGFAYVWMTNSTAATGFEIEKLQGQLKDIRDTNERLELSAADLRALSVVNSTTQDLQLEPTDRFDVLPAAGAVAVR